MTGYSDNHKTYRLIDVDTDRLIFCRDVVFDETRGPFLSSPEQCSEDQPHSVPLASSNGRDDANNGYDTDDACHEAPIADPIEAPKHNPLPAPFAPPLSGLNGGLKLLVISGMMSSLRVELPEIRANSSLQLILLLWLTFIVFMSPRLILRLTVSLSGNRL